MNAMISLRTALLFFFEAFLSSLAYFVVIYVRVAIDSSLPIASKGPPFRGQKYMRHRRWHAGCLSESGGTAEGLVDSVTDTTASLFKASGGLSTATAMFWFSMSHPNSTRRTPTMTNPTPASIL